MEGIFVFLFHPWTFSPVWGDVSLFSGNHTSLLFARNRTNNTRKEGIMGKELTNSGLSRRSFLKGAAATGVLASITVATGCSSEGKTQASSVAKWDATYDVIVVGCGFAGMATAITATNEGAKVAVLEAAPEEFAGGNSRVCGQLVWSPQNAEVAKAYYLELNEGYVDDMPEGMIEAFVTEAANNQSWIETEIGVPMKARPYPEYTIAKNVAAGSECVCPQEGMSGAQLWTPMHEYATSLDIDFLYQHEARKLVVDDQGIIVGVQVQADGSDKFLQANKGVAICCGGFENNNIMKANYLGAPGRPIGSPYNKGQGILMCQAVGADLWHMRTAMTPMNFDFKGYSAPGFEDNAITVSTSVTQGAIWLDKYGKRFMDESRSSQHGLGLSQILWEDSNKLETPRAPLWIVANDEQVQKTGLFTSSTAWVAFFNGFKPSKGCVDEIEKGWVLKADSIAELAQKMNLDNEVLSATIERYNDLSSKGVDEDFGRTAETLKALQPPFYAISVYPGLLNTDGGPRRDAQGRVLSVWGDPIPHLYSAGEIGSIWAHHYQGSGNVGECLAFGRIVGKAIASVSEK